MTYGTSSSNYVTLENVPIGSLGPLGQLRDGPPVPPAEDWKLDKRVRGLTNQKLQVKV